MILLAEHLLSPDGDVVPGGLVVEGGRIERVLAGDALRRARGGDTVELDGGLLAPGLVDAHAHLELSAMAGALDAPDPDAEGASFVEWIGAVLARHRELGEEDYAAGVAAGARMLLAGGCTTVGDIASTPAGAHAPREGLRAVVFREVLDAWNPERTDGVLESVSHALPARRLRTEGLSPHAPYTVSPRLLGAIGALATERSAPVQVHWSETRAETRWMREGDGPLAGLLPAGPGRRALEILEEAALLGPGTSLVHGNHPEDGEPELLASRGVTLVHCPGSHAWFGREPFPWARYRGAGVPLALGTDSLASNEGLDMRREMALLRAAHPELEPGEVLEAATLGGARALGLGEVVGRLAPGFRADLVHHRFPSGTAAGEFLEALTSGRSRVDRLWVEGRSVRLSAPLS